MKVRTIRFKLSKRLPEFYKEEVVKFHYKRNRHLSKVTDPIKHIKVSTSK